MERNEPSTKEIVRALREEAGIELGGKAAMIHLSTVQSAIDRLESQEREIAGKDVQIATLTEKCNALENDAINYDMNLSEMTARAESAERERDAAIADVRRCCETCLHGQQSESRCAIGVNGKCYFGGYDYWEWRGKPQEGTVKICAEE